MGVMANARQRISPAHAGNTVRVCRASSRRGDQPRTCGEYWGFRPDRSRLRGSAPHMRGIRIGRANRGGHPGISPAHAGNTDRAINSPPDWADQPRTCGEYPASLSRLRSQRGSAPHMRGILGSHLRVFLSVGISPAHAGNTVLGGASFPVAADQPRTCGEYQVNHVWRRAELGSAPHMRGIRTVRCPSDRARRISPAHAGNTLAVLARASIIRDQPRTCGEYISMTGAWWWSPGSAPHMRGIRARASSARAGRRISPAHAGNTHSGALRAPGAGDQPRTCGEYPLLSLY